MLDLHAMAREDDARSFSNRMRTKRFVFFERLCAGLPRPLRIIDIGGTNAFWEQRGWANRSDVHVTMVNLVPEAQVHDNLESRQGDATDLAEFADQSFAIAFSNSVIEHLFTWDKQLAMARETRRVAWAYWVQTPNFWFPIEPHFHFPGWQWMPESLRVAIIRRRKCGWRGPCPYLSAARDAVREIRLLTKRELRRLYPDATIRPERFCGLAKSWIVYNGFSNP